MSVSVKPEASDFNSRLVISALFIAVWFAVREPLLGLPSGPTVLIEWLVFLLFALWIVLQPPMNMRGKPLTSVIAVVAVVYLKASAWRQEDLGEWSMYWRGFGSSIAIISLVGAVATSCITIWRPAVLRNGALKQAVTFAAHGIAVIAILWMLPSVLQPMDGWLNIGDATEKVLDEISGPVVGNIPGYNQAAGYSTLLGIPLLPLRFIAGREQEKFVLLVLWVNVLIVGVPLLIAAIVRKIEPGMSRVFALVIGFVAVTISGNPVGNEPPPFNFNTSLFRELSFLARGIFPLLVGYVVASSFQRGIPSSRRIILLAWVATLSAINNPELGVGSAVAAMVVVMVHSRGSGELRRVARLYVATVLTCGVVLVVPGAFFGGDWVSRRLGMFVAVLSGEGSTLSAGSVRDIPALGIVTLTYSVAVAAVAIAARTIRNNHRQRIEPVASVALYFGLWVLLSAPYTLNAGGNGAFGAQFHLIPLAVLSVSLFRLFRLSERICDHNSIATRLQKGSLPQRLSLVPVSFLMTLVIAAGLSSPNSFTEWRRVQAPVSDQKWTDEWSTEQLDWIRPSEAVALANEVGGVSQVGWWFSHGNAIELLTGIENLLGTSVFEGAVKGNAIREQACEPITRSSLRYVITDYRYVAVLGDCVKVEISAVSSANEDGMVLVTLER